MPRRLTDISWKRLRQYELMFWRCQETQTKLTGGGRIGGQRRQQCRLLIQAPVGTGTCSWKWMAKARHVKKGECSRDQQDLKESKGVTGTGWSVEEPEVQCDSSLRFHCPQLYFTPQFPHVGFLGCMNDCGKWKPLKTRSWKGPSGRHLKFLFCGMISERESMAKSRTGRFLSDSPGSEWWKLRQVERSVGIMKRSKAALEVSWYVLCMCACASFKCAFGFRYSGVALQTKTANKILCKELEIFDSYCVLSPAGEETSWSLPCYGRGLRVAMGKGT